MGRPSQIERLLKGLILTGLLLVVFVSIIRALILDCYYLRGQSMEPTLHQRSLLWVEKWTMGGRVIRMREPSSNLCLFRLPGLGQIKPGDIAVFNSPEGDHGEIKFNRLLMYAKRCIGAPGDTVQIINGFFNNTSCPGHLLCPLLPQLLLSERIVSTSGEDNEPQGCLSGTNWSIKDFGPLFIPAKGSTIFFDDSLSISLYNRIVKYEVGQNPQIGDEYTFKNNWFFFAGDNVLNSRDSRYYGLVPEIFIVGKVLGIGQRGKIYEGMIKEDKDLEDALVFAGKNRGELERVLAHYSGDTRKRSASEWLIRNMRYHYGFEPNERVDSVKTILKDIYEGKPVQSNRKALLAKYQVVPLRKVWDSKVITADYLVDNIDKAFEVYESRPWNNHLSFEDFCETILPYRVGNEPLERWRENYYSRYGYLLDSLYQGRDIIIAADSINHSLTGFLFKLQEDYHGPDLGPNFLLDNHIGGCQEICAFSLYLLRALGIPASTDYLKKEFIHSWTVVVDTTKAREFLRLFAEDNHHQIKRGEVDYRTKGKVFRKVFSPVDGRMYKDVSDEYFGKKDHIVTLGHKPQSQVWLGMYTNGCWWPIVPGKVRGRKVSFGSLEPEIVYAPITRNGKELGYPFVYQRNGGFKHFVPKTNSDSIRTTRITRLSRNTTSFLSENEGSIIEGSQNIDFINPEWKNQIPLIHNNYYWMYPETKIRYLRIRPAYSKKLQLGELRVFRDSLRKDTVAIRRESFIPNTEMNEDLGFIIDNDDMTYYRSEEESSYIILDLGTIEDVKVIEWVPRNDDSFIRFHDEYELFFNNGPNGWCSLGTQVAEDTVLFWRGIPQNALFRLHNRSRGNEEDAFISELGTQKFVSWTTL